MGRIGKISPIKKEYSKDLGQTLGSSLYDKGMTMFPNTIKGIVPYRERNGAYRTGLDPDALYIKFMNPEEAAIEKARVKEMHDALVELTGLDLSPRSPYYEGMFTRDPYDTDNFAQYVKLQDGPNIFNLDIAQQAITFAWLRVHPEIAPSMAAYQSGTSNHRCPRIANCQFFVDDEDFQAELEYKANMVIDKAINTLFTLSPTKQLKVAKLLSLPVSYSSKPEQIYNELTKFIKDPMTKGKKTTNVSLFNSIIGMADQNLEIKFKVKEALDFNVYRKGKGGKIYEGETLVADSEDELIEYLSVKKNQEDFLALQKKIETAKSITL